jgi:AcrR family transcriptional regulator
MHQMKQDRRSLRTQDALIQALLEMIDVKSYDKITVQDIVERANVGRSTFYAHYEDKDDLLRSGFGQMLDLLVQDIRLSDDGHVTFNVTWLFAHAKLHSEIYETLMWGSGEKVLVGDGYAQLCAKVEDRFVLLLAGRDAATIPMPILACSVAGAVLLLLKWWLDNRMPYPAAAMDSVFQQLVIPGLEKVLAPATPGRAP